MADKNTAILLGFGGAVGALIWFTRRAGKKAIAETAAAEGESVESTGVVSQVIAAVVGAWKWFARPATANLQEQDIWYSLDAPVTSDPAIRSAVMLESVIDQFEVDRNLRYVPRIIPGATKRSTFCNIFVQDVARAMGVDLPWGNANTLADYLKSEEAANRGWYQTNPADAQANANAGRLVVTAWSNPGGTGHVQIVRPGVYTAAAGPTVAQAGSVNYGAGTAARGVGASRLAQLTYHVHA